MFCWDQDFEVDTFIHQRLIHKRRPPCISELTPMIYKMELSLLRSEASEYKHGLFLHQFIFLKLTINRLIY